MKMPPRLRLGSAIALLSAATPSVALNTATIIQSALSPDCLEYRVVGICYWLHCSWSGCRVRTSVKVRHYVPDAVVSSYNNTGENPWLEVQPMSPPNPTAQAGGDGTTNQNHENNLAKFKNADVIGHPAAALFDAFAAGFGYSCDGAGTAFRPYLLSTLDTLAWRYNVPETVYPEALTPGLREIGSRSTLNLWGNVYPRGGFLHQSDDHKAGAVVAQRAGDIVTRRGQLHVYQPLLASAQDGYWPAGALIESDASTGKWQALTPRLSMSCAVFPHSGPLAQARRGDYAWALWRPYSCC
jgi:integrating conjugative element protein (TIGR03756 family)